MASGDDAMAKSAKIRSITTVSPSWRGQNRKSPLCLLCRVVSKILLQRLVADLLRTCWRHLDMSSVKIDCLCRVAADAVPCSPVEQLLHVLWGSSASYSWTVRLSSYCAMLGLPVRRNVFHTGRKLGIENINTV